jgi:hypothetical protein
LPTSSLLIAGILAIFLVAFLWFVIRGLTHWLRLRRVGATLQKARDVKAFDEAFADDKLLKHLWKEYRDTLHAEKEFDAQQNQYVAKRWRATVPAEAVFSTNAIVDNRLGTEFFKHLPGILTGIGIIGTFAGLILGLWNFQVSSDNAQVQKSLNDLLFGVKEAFMVSFVAISLAIFATIIEKLLVTGMYAAVERICQALDSRFESGASEEYLARLVRASESSEKETKILKDALVADLKRILEEMTTRQMEQQAANAKMLSQSIVSGITGGLNPPLEQMRDALKLSVGKQVEGVNELVINTMSSLTAQIRDIFEKQIGQVNAFQAETVAQLQTAIGSLNGLAEKLGATSSAASAEMAKHISQAVADLEQRQRDMTAEFAKAVEAMQANTASGQQAALQSTQTAVAALSESVQQAVTMLQSQAQATAQRDEERARALATQAQSASDSLQSVLEKSHVQLGELTGAIQASVDRMEKVTTASVDKMNQGAETLYVASSDFAKASTATGALVGKAEALSQGLTAASSTLAGSSGVLANALAEYKLVRDEVQRMVTELRATVEAARREASLTAETLARIEAAANSLAVAQKQADEYLKGVSDVLSEAHSSFASNITNTLRTANGAFHEHLTNSTKILGSAIEELGDVIDRIPTPS